MLNLYTIFWEPILDILDWWLQTPVLSQPPFLNIEQNLPNWPYSRSISLFRFFLEHPSVHDFTGLDSSQQRGPASKQPQVASHSDQHGVTEVPSVFSTLFSKRPVFQCGIVCYNMVSNCWFNLEKTVINQANPSNFNEKKVKHPIVQCPFAGRSEAFDVAMSGALVIGEVLKGLGWRIENFKS